MVHNVGDIIDGCTTTDGHTLRVGSPCYVIDDEHAVRVGIVLYRRAVGALVFIDGVQWPSRVAIFAKRAAAEVAARAAAKRGA